MLLLLTFNKYLHDDLVAHVKKMLFTLNLKTFLWAKTFQINQKIMSVKPVLCLTVLQLALDKLLPQEVTPFWNYDPKQSFSNDFVRW